MFESHQQHQSFQKRLPFASGRFVSFRLVEFFYIALDIAAPPLAKDMARHGVNAEALSKFFTAGIDVPK